MLETKIENKEGILVIAPIGRLDGLTSKDFLEATENEITNEANKVILNLENLDYISSEGCVLFLLRQKKPKRSMDNCYFWSQRCVKEVLDISGFGQMLGVFATEEEH